MCERKQCRGPAWSLQGSTNGFFFVLGVDSAFNLDLMGGEVLFFGGSGGVVS